MANFDLVTGDWVAAVDIGGTKVSVSLAQAGPGQPVLRGQQVLPTPTQGDVLTLVRQIQAQIDASCAHLGLQSHDIRAVGVASCGPFVMQDGCAALAAPNLCGGLAGPARGLPNDWRALPLEAPLRARFGQVRVEIDTLGALEAERRWGVLEGVDHCAYVTWSTGIGMGLCVDGHALRGKNGNAGHAGHAFVVDDDSALCGCGNRGDVESLVAGNAIARRFGVDAATLFGQARQGDALALSRVNGLCAVMGRSLYNLVVTLDLQRISLGGSVYWHQRDLLLPRLQAQVHGKLPALTDGCELLSAGLGNQVGDYAALALVL